MMYWYGGGHMGTGGWLLMIALSVLFWGGLLATIAFMIVRLTGTPAPRRDDARRVLDDRFARGEVDADEYARRRDLLARR